MRLILTVCILGSAIFAGYWMISAQAITRYGPDALAQSPHIDAQPRDVRGFPFAFRTEFENLHWRSRDQALEWQVPLVALEAASYLPNRIQARLSPTQTLTYMGEQIVLQLDEMLARLDVDHTLTVTKAALTADSATATPAAYVQALDSLDAGLQRGDTNQYDLNVSAQGLHLSPDTRRVLDPMGNHPDQIALIAVDASVAFNGPLALNTPLPLPQTISVRDIRFDWGEFNLTGEGQLQLTASGGLDGTVALRLQDWRVLHALLVETGAITPDAAMMAGFFLGSQAEPGGDAINLTLNINESAVAFGPFVIGYLPRF